MAQTSATSRLTSAQTSVSRLAYFERSLATKFLSKAGQIFVYILGCFEKLHFYAKTVVTSFWGQLLEKIGLLFIVASGRTGRDYGAV